ncbi:hypothetical protein Q7C36_004295 [Tachysurus vachellii]|uniref:Uncharacterized protein n=1 Tax=Tachysurus vachellii TaxID=175792 RepID=A0AA88NLW4_TACVA|nr:hypothetical protein Q7C36_004295 [Tachysurus vachellii]
MLQAAKSLLDCGTAPVTLSTLHAPYLRLTGGAGMERHHEKTAKPRRMLGPRALSYSFNIGDRLTEKYLSCMSSLVKFFQKGVEGCREPPNKSGFPEFSRAQTPTGARARKRSRGGLAGEIIRLYKLSKSLELRSGRVPLPLTHTPVLWLTLLEPHVQQKGQVPQGASFIAPRIWEGLRSWSGPQFKSAFLSFRVSSRLVSPCFLYVPQTSSSSFSARP